MQNDEIKTGRKEINENKKKRSKIIQPAIQQNTRSPTKHPNSTNKQKHRSKKKIIFVCARETNEIKIKSKYTDATLLSLKYRILIFEHGKANALLKHVCLYMYAFIWN